MASFPSTIPNDGIDNEPPIPDEQEEAVPDYGPNNENLPVEMVGNLVTLARKFCEEDRYSRRLEVQECRRARFYWRGMQHLYWDYGNSAWQALGPSGGPAGSVNTTSKVDDSSILYTTNIYQAFGLTLQAVLTQNMPTVRFEPQDPSDPADVETAKAANRMKKIIEHNNDAVMRLTEATYYLYTDGRVGGYTRFEDDKRTGQPIEKISMVGAMELKVPITAECQEDFVYLQWSDEYHLAVIKDEIKNMSFQDPKYYQKIKGGAAGNGEDVYERTARISVKQGVALLTQSGDTLSHLVTRQNTWLRPSAFQMLEDTEDGIKEQFLELFPEGCHVRVDNGVYTGSWAEKMDDSWAIMHAMPGDGQFRNGLGTSLTSVQERFNDIINITQDVYEKTIPASWTSDKAVDSDGTFRQRSFPGARYPFPKQPGEAIGESFFFEPPANVSPDMLKYGQELMGPIAQFLTGAFPALFGGDTAGNDTASGIAQQRDQAMGRIGLPWRSIKRFWARVMEQAVRCAAKNRTDDVSIGVPDDHGNVETTQVRIEELQGQIFCYPDSDENFPESWTQKRAAYMALIPVADKDPVLGSVLHEPDNMEEARKLIGLEDFKIPGADSGLKQMAEINTMLDSGGPIPSQPVPVPNPMTGQVMLQPGPPQSSVPIDPDYDDNAAELAKLTSWINSPEGQKAKREKPAQFEDVRLHGNLHRQAIQAKQAPPQQRPPSVSINYADLPPEGQAQAAQEAGIQLNPQDFVMQHQMEVAKKPPPPVISPKV